MKEIDLNLKPWLHAEIVSSLSMKITFSVISTCAGFGAYAYPDWTFFQGDLPAVPADWSLRSRRVLASRRTSPYPGSCTRTGWNRSLRRSAPELLRTDPPETRFPEPAGSDRSGPGQCYCWRADCASRRSRVEGEGCWAWSLSRPCRFGASRGAHRGRGTGGASRRSAGRTRWAAWLGLWWWERRPGSWQRGGCNSQCRACRGTGWRTRPSSDTFSQRVRPV